MKMIDGNLAALREYESNMDKRFSDWDRADAKREELIDEWLDEYDPSSVEELICELIYRDPSILTTIRRMLIATSKGRNLSKELDRDCVIAPAVSLCKAIRNEVDRVYGDELVDKEAHCEP